MTASDPRVGEIQARLDAATPGPWRWDEKYGDAGDTGLALTNDAGAEIVGAYNTHCCSFRDDPTVEDNDAEFIAAAPADVAYLLAELRKHQTKLDGPCGSCHPCTEWANQTWVNAGERLPHVHEWQEMKAKVAAYEAAHAKLNDWAGRNRTGFYDEAQDDVVKIIRAAVAAANGGGA